MTSIKLTIVPELCITDRVLLCEPGVDSGEFHTCSTATVIAGELHNFRLCWTFL